MTRPTKSRTRGILHPNGNQTEEMVPTGIPWRIVLTVGQKDIMDNWPVYRKRFSKELKKLKEFYRAKFNELFTQIYPAI